jgi:hypothetical protein
LHRQERAVRLVEEIPRTNLSLCRMTKLYNRPMNFFEKLHSGWWWIGQIFEEWCYIMRNEDGDFFEYLQSDYVAYEQEMYYD